MRTIYVTFRNEVVVRTLFFVIVSNFYCFSTACELINDSDCTAICLIQIHLDDGVSICSYRNIACVTNSYQFESVSYFIDSSQFSSSLGKLSRHQLVYIVTFEAQRISSIFTCFFRDNVVQVEDRIVFITIFVPFHTIDIIRSAGSRSHVKRTVEVILGSRSCRNRSLRQSIVTSWQVSNFHSQVFEDILFTNVVQSVSPFGLVIIVSQNQADLSELTSSCDRNCSCNTVIFCSLCNIVSAVCVLGELDKTGVSVAGFRSFDDRHHTLCEFQFGNISQVFSLPIIVVAVFSARRCHRFRNEVHPYHSRVAVTCRQAEFRKINIVAAGSFCQYSSYLRVWSCPSISEYLQSCTYIHCINHFCVGIFPVRPSTLWEIRTCISADRIPHVNFERYRRLLTCHNLLVVNKCIITARRHHSCCSY